MSGYSSKAEALQVLKDTLDSGMEEQNLPAGAKHYNVSAVFNEMFYSPRRGEWRLTSYDSDDFADSMRKHLRTSGKIMAGYLERAANRAKAESLPWGDEKCRLMYGYGVETYNAM